MCVGGSGGSGSVISVFSISQSHMWSKTPHAHINNKEEDCECTHTSKGSRPINVKNRKQMGLNKIQLALLNS